MILTVCFFTLYEYKAPIGHDAISIAQQRMTLKSPWRTNRRGEL